MDKRPTVLGLVVNTLTHGSGGIVSPEGVKKHGTHVKLNPVGASPYLVSARR